MNGGHECRSNTHNFNILAKHKMEKNEVENLKLHSITTVCSNNNRAKIKMQYCQKLIRFHHIRLYLDLNLCNEDLLAKICKNVKILCTTPPMATTGTVTHTTLTFLQTCKNVKVVCVTPFIGSKNVKVWHYINFARMLRFVHITLT